MAEVERGMSLSFGLWVPVRGGAVGREQVPPPPHEKGIYKNERGGLMGRQRPISCRACPVSIWGYIKGHEV